MPLTEKEKKELEMLDNPDIEYFSPASGGLFSSLINSNLAGNRKERVVELRIKIRMEEAGLNENEDWQKYHEIQNEEENRFDERFKK